MIHVNYYRRALRVTMEGHAQSGEMGKDLICAGCSILAYTLAANAEDLQTMGYAQDKKITLEPGNAEICIQADEKFRSVATLMMDTLCVGFEILASKFPDHVTYDIHG